MRKFSYLLRIAVLLLSLLFTLFVSEGLARWLVPTRIEGNLIRYLPENRRRLIKGTRGIIKKHDLSGQDVFMRINSLGFRGPEFPKEKPRNEKRIIFLGDSVTMADYLDEEQTFVVRIQRILNSTISKFKIRTINAAIGDIGLRDAREIFEEARVGVSPDLVVIGFYLNDSRPPWGFPQELGRRGWLRQNSQLADIIYQRMKLKGWIKEKGEHRFPSRDQYEHLDWRNKTEDFYKLARLFRYDWGSAWEKGSWDSVENEFRIFNSLSEKKGSKLLWSVFRSLIRFMRVILRPNRKIKSRKSAASSGLISTILFLSSD